MEANDNLRIAVNLHGNNVELGRENLSLFTHIGEAAMYDHVFIVYNDDELEETITTYIPVTAPAYPGLKDFIIEFDFVRHQGLDEVADCDRESIDQFFFKDVRETESFPESWVA